MRRLIAASMVVAAALVTAGCAGDPAAPGTVASVRVARTSAGPPIDPVVTKQVCGEAKTGTTDTVRFFHDQLLAIESAAARGDQASVVLAADAIQQRIVGLATSLIRWSQLPVSPTVKGTLLLAASSLLAVSSKTYPGNQADISRRLDELKRKIDAVCR